MTGSGSRDIVLFIYSCFILSLPTGQIVDSISKIFRGQRELVVGFNRFLPPGYRIVYIPGMKVSLLGKFSERKLTD